jgi:hypothetical protein
MSATNPDLALLMVRGIGTILSHNPDIRMEKSPAG